MTICTSHNSAFNSNHLDGEYVHFLFNTTSKISELQQSIGMYISHMSQFLKIIQSATDIQFHSDAAQVEFDLFCAMGKHCEWSIPSLMRQEA